MPYIALRDSDRLYHEDRKCRTGLSWLSPVVLSEVDFDPCPKCGAVMFEASLETELARVGAVSARRLQHRG